MLPEVNPIANSGSDSNALDQLLESLPIAVITFKRGVLVGANTSFHEYIGPEVSHFLKPGISLREYVGHTHLVNQGLIVDGPSDANNITSILYKTNKEAWVEERLKNYRYDNTCDEYDDEGGWWRVINKYYPADDTYIGIRIDINEVKCAQEKAVIASRAKSEFLANMSHEIRTPMNGVVGMAQILRNSEMTPKQLECVNIIIQSGDALLTIINDILDFSKIEAGKLNLEATPFDFEEAAEGVVSLLGVTATQKNIELILDYQNHSGRLAVGDSGRIRQILTNLVGNAIKFTTTGFVLLKIQIYEKDAKLGIEIEIKDTGIGIAKESIKSIFEEFSQADNSTTRKYGGTGLGLTITKSLVKAMGGNISVQSELDEGTRIMIDLNLTSGDFVDDVSDVKKNHTLLNFSASTRALIVDDKKSNLLALDGLLTKLGLKTDTANSARAAVDKIKQIRKENSNYDLLITNYEMPEIDGYKLVSAIRKNPILESVQIIALSSVNCDVLENNFSSFKNCRYQQKPAQLSHIRSIIEKTLQGVNDIPTEPSQARRKLLIYSRKSHSEQYEEQIII